MVLDASSARLALPLAKLLIADTAMLKQTFEGSGSSKEDLQSMLPVVCEVKKWAIDASCISMLISCLFASKMLAGDSLSWAEFNIGLREVQAAAETDESYQDKAADPDDEQPAETEFLGQSMARMNELIQTIGADKNRARSPSRSPKRRKKPDAASAVLSPSRLLKKPEAEYLQDATARIEDMVLSQRRALEKSRQATLASDPPPLPPPATSIARDLANALSTDGGRSALRSIFDALDTNGDGRVSKLEWGGIESTSWHSPSTLGSRSRTSAAVSARWTRTTLPTSPLKNSVQVR